MSSRLKEFEQHEQHVKERIKTYGHPSANFGRIAAMKTVIAACKHPEARHALEMIAEAVARLIECPDHVDSWSNIAGYARCGIMVTETNEVATKSDPNYGASSWSELILSPHLVEYTRQEGGTWFGIIGLQRDYISDMAFALKFKDGSIYDRVAGWR